MIWGFPLYFWWAYIKTKKGWVGAERGVFSGTLSPNWTSTNQFLNLNTTRIPEIPLGEIHEISSISVRFLEILLVLDEFQDVSLNSVGFQKISKILTDIGENFKKFQKFSLISVGISKFQKISPISVKISKISRNLTDIGGNFKNFKREAELY